MSRVDGVGRAKFDSTQVEGLNDPRYSKARAQLALGARVVDRELVCPDCIASYLRRVTVRVEIKTRIDGVAREVDGQIQYTKVEAGRRACDVWKDLVSSRRRVRCQLTS